MRCLVTCGPTYESLDQVRRLTNFSTGKLGIGLANHLHAAGHQVTLLKGYYATCTDSSAVPATIFTTTADLAEHFRAAAREGCDAIFHAAAVSDFGFGRIYRRAANDSLEAVTSGKFSTRDGNLLAELVPAPKLISQLHALFPAARICGWKYEVDGTRESAIQLALQQILENETNCSVVNGPAYGGGFGIVRKEEPTFHCHDAAALYAALLRIIS